MIPAGVTVAFIIGVMRFSERARVGLTVRRMASVRSRAGDRAAGALAGVDVRFAVAGVLAGATIAGSFGMLVGVVAGLAWRPVRAARAESRRLAVLDDQVPDALRTIASAMRAGRSVPLALSAACEAAEPPLRDALDAAMRRIAMGASLDEALEDLETRAPTETVRAAVDSLRVGRAAGGNVPAVLDVSVDALAERARVARDRRSATAQARMSAGVVAAMPFAFFALLGSGARAQLDVLFGGPAGWCLLGLGLLLETAGVVWMRSLVRTP